jgi:alpha-D-xyloside xylohydrolase
MLEKYVRVRSAMKSYIQELDKNVSSQGVPTMRPLAYEFPADQGCRGINDQYLLGPTYLVAPVTTQNSTSRSVYFPAGASWQHYFTGEVVKGGQRITVEAPLDEIPVYRRH